MRFIPLSLLLVSFHEAAGSRNKILGRMAGDAYKVGKKSFRTMYTSSPTNGGSDDGIQFYDIYDEDEPFSYTNEDKARLPKVLGKLRKAIPDRNGV